MRERDRKLGRMSREELDAFIAEFPFRVNHLPSEHGTDHDRKLVRAFFITLGRPVHTTTNKVWLTTETDLVLYQLGMWR